MPDRTLHDYAEVDPPEVTLVQPVFHPDQAKTVIGHTGVDNGRGEAIATFPRNREEGGATHQKHYFEKYAGYGISERVLDILRGRGVDTVLIVERDADQRVIEYDYAAFASGRPIAYSPEEDSIIEGDAAIEYADCDVYNDRQRVAPEDEARYIWNRVEVTLHQ
jgi:hypothetical protein